MAWGYGRRRMVLDMDTDGNPVQRTVKAARRRCTSCLSSATATVKGDHEASGAVLRPRAAASVQARDAMALLCMDVGCAEAGRRFGLDEKTARSAWDEWAGMRWMDVPVPADMGVHVVSVTGQGRTLVTDMDATTVVALLPDEDASLRAWLGNEAGIIRRVAIGFHPMHRRILHEMAPSAQLLICTAHSRARALLAWQAAFSSLLRREGLAAHGVNAREDSDMLGMPDDGWRHDAVSSWRTPFRALHASLDAFMVAMLAGDGVGMLDATQRCRQVSGAEVPVAMVNAWSDEMAMGQGAPEGYGDMVSLLTEAMEGRRPRLSFPLLRGRLLLKAEMQRMITETEDAAEGVEHTVRLLGVGMHDAMTVISP